MSLKAALTNVLLPPLLLVVLVFVTGLGAWRGRRLAGAAAAFCALGLLVLATPYAAGRLTVMLERMASTDLPSGASPPGAIIVLGGEMAHSEAGPEVGPLTLERLRAAAALHRRTGLPVLLTGGRLSPGAPPIAALMAACLEMDFGIVARWVEPRARNTWENAAFSAAVLRAEGINAALVVSHAWHLPRAQLAFVQEEFPVAAAPVRFSRLPQATVLNWIPRPDYLAQTWFMLREWAGMFVYGLWDLRGSKVLYEAAEHL